MEKNKGFNNTNYAGRCDGGRNNEIGEKVIVRKRGGIFKKQITTNPHKPEEKIMAERRGKAWGQTKFTEK